MRDKRTQPTPTNVTADSIADSRDELLVKLKLILRKLDDVTEELFMDRLDRYPNGAEILGLCDRWVNMTLVETLDLYKEQIGPVLESMCTYIRMRFEEKSISTIQILGFVLNVHSLISPSVPSFSRQESVDQRLVRLDKDLSAAMGGEPMPQDKFVGLLFNLASKVNPAFVSEKYEGELGARLGAFVSEKLNTPVHGTVSIGGQLYAVSPVLENKPTPNIDAMRRSQEINQTRDMFRPYLIRSIYSYLVGKAFLGHTTTYENIANEFGLPNRGNQLGSTLSPLLASIYHFCRNNQQPHLTAIVVRKSGEDKDLPGKGFWDLYNAVDDRHERRVMTKNLQAEVFAYWGSLGQ